MCVSSGCTICAFPSDLDSMMPTISHGVPTDIRGIIIAEAGGRQHNTKIMNTNQFSLANRKQLADMLADKYDSLRSKADRKSTRLNSSHLGISYAVFCL